MLYILQLFCIIIKISFLLISEILVKILKFIFSNIFSDLWRFSRGYVRATKVCGWIKLDHTTNKYLLQMPTDAPPPPSLNFVPKDFPHLWFKIPLPNQPLSRFFIRRTGVNKNKTNIIIFKGYLQSPFKGFMPLGASWKANKINKYKIYLSLKTNGRSTLTHVRKYFIRSSFQKCRRVKLRF